jgi:hypothetical protein
MFVERTVLDISYTRLSGAVRMKYNSKLTMDLAGQLAITKRDARLYIAAAAWWR